VAQVIEFYVPARFKKKVIWVPNEQRGKVIAFRPDPLKSSLGPNIRRGCTTMGHELLFGRDGMPSIESGLGTVQRTAYDSLSRLLYSSDPENSSAACPAFGGTSPTRGAVLYVYNPDGTLHSKTAARNITELYVGRSASANRRFLRQ
jgi:hypothetical protein